MGTKSFKASRNGSLQPALVTANQPLLVDVLSRRDQRILNLLIGAWLLTVACFTAWWFRPGHVENPWLFAFNSFVLGWGIIMPAYYFYFLRRMKKPNPALPIPVDWRIAMVVTRAPSEPFAMAQKTLLAMKAQDVPHDTWLADEDPSPEILAWCREHDIKVSTRRGVAAYHRSEWPRRTKCKEGNLAYFYDHYGYDNYDFVSQLDTDHVPTPGYLRQMLLPFWDPKVGYVSAPSICDLNAKKSWTARGRLSLECHIHGSLQAGYHSGWVPMCIGSHYAVRSKALKEIGGVGPELAEDHSTTFLMNAGGWIGCHSIDAEAHGEGPATFMDGMVQEFQWARSLVMIFLSLTPQHLHKLNLRLKFQFLFGQLWYFGFSAAMMGAYVLPPLAVFLQRSFAHVSYLEFALYSIWPTLTSILAVLFLKRRKLLRPVDAKVICWEGICFQLARWPWVAWAVIDAFRASIDRSHLSWKVTPKSGIGASVIPIQFLVPYFLIIASSALVAFCSPPTLATRGYYYFTLINVVTYIFLLLWIPYLNRRETRTTS